MIIVVGIILAVVLFLIQLLLCFKATKTTTRRIPIYIILFGGVLCLLALGSDSRGSVLDGSKIAALILAIVVGIALIGVVAAWAVYKIYMKIQKNNEE